MRLVVRVPPFSPAVEAVAVVAWAKAPGDVVEYGDPLCDVVVQEVTRMRRPLSALSKTPKVTQYGKIDVQVQYRITALDVGVVSAIAVQEGDSVAIGEDLAILESDEGVGDAVARVVVNLIDEQGIDQ